MTPEFTLDVIAVVLHLVGAVDRFVKFSLLTGVVGTVALAAGVVGAVRFRRASRKFDAILDEPATPPLAEADDPAWGGDFLDLAEAFEAVPDAKA